MRNYNEADNAKMRAVAYSEDFGASWGRLRFDPVLIEPVCQASILRYSWPKNGQKSRILFSNPADKEERVRMTVRLSYDEGQTWPVKRVVHPERCEYSCLTVLPDATIGLMFKGDRKIMFTKFSLAWLVGDDHGN
jgi:sialidase-1